MTGSADAILAAIRREIEVRRALLDGATDLAEVTIQVKLQTGTSLIRGLTWTDERAFRRVPPQQKDASDSLRA